MFIAIDPFIKVGSQSFQPYSPILGEMQRQVEPAPQEAYTNFPESVN